MLLNTVSTGPGQSAFITAPVGSILNGAAPGVFNVLSGNVQLFANNNIGADDDHITTELGTNAAPGSIEAQSTTGSTWVDNSGALNVGGSFTGNTDGAVSGGSTTITASSPITLTKSILSGGNVLVIAHYNAGESVPANLIVDALDLSGKALFVKAAGSVRLLAGQDITIQNGALVEAGVAAVIQGGYVGDLSGVASREGLSPTNVTVTVAGKVVAPTIQIAGGTGNDLIQTTASAVVLAQFPWTPSSFNADFGKFAHYPRGGPHGIGDRYPRQCRKRPDLAARHDCRGHDEYRRRRGKRQHHAQPGRGRACDQWSDQHHRRHRG